MFLTPYPVPGVIYLPQNIRLHEYVVLVNQMSAYGFYGCIPRIPKEHGRGEGARQEGDIRIELHVNLPLEHSSTLNHIIR